MPVPKTVLDARGAWAGASTLFMSKEDPGDKGVSKMEVFVAETLAYARIAYTWTYKGTTQEGQILVASGDSETTLGWTDSWHQSSSVMQLAGTAGDDVDCLGGYRVEGHPDWGWRIKIERESVLLVFKMYNVSPEGDEVLAVEAFYSRV